MLNFNQILSDFEVEKRDFTPKLLPNYPQITPKLVPDFKF
jgi:hypothetical protein